MNYFVMFKCATTVFCGSFILCLMVVTHTVAKKRKFKNTAIKKILAINICSIFLMMVGILGTEKQYMDELYQQIESYEQEIETYEKQNEIYIDTIDRLVDENDNLKDKNKDLQKKSDKLSARIKKLKRK